MNRVPRCTARCVALGVAGIVALLARGMETLW